MASYDINTVKNDRINEQYEYIKHPSGLDIYIWKMDNYSTTHALFGTKYGSINTTFKTTDDKDYVTVPEGIAHYLEHKLFENEDCDVFSLYAKTGACANAYTSFDKTCYLFSCTDNFEDSLEILLNFVQEPYFTEETVRKEQGIIGQEIRMYDDNAGWRVFFNLLGALYHKHPVKIDIAGTVESISHITAELLYKCYYTFYNLNNMVLSIAGNVDSKKVLEICDRLLKPCQNKELQSYFEKEPLEVVEPVVRQKLEIATPMFSIGYKTEPLTGKERLRAEVETNMALSLLCDESSSLYKEMYEDGLINSTFGSEVFDGDGYFAAMISGESRKPLEVMERINAEIERCKGEGLDRERFELVKKSYYGAQVRGVNNVEAVATLMLNSAMDGVTPFDTIEIIAETTFEDVMKRLFVSLDSRYSAISIIDPAE